MKTMTLSLEINGIERRSDIALYKEVVNSETGEVRPVPMTINRVFPLTLQGNSLHFIKQGKVGKLFTALSDEQLAALEA